MQFAFSRIFLIRENFSFALVSKRIKPSSDDVTHLVLEPVSHHRL